MDRSTLAPLLPIERQLFGRLVTRALGSEKAQRNIENLGPDGAVLLACARSYNLCAIVFAFIALLSFAALPKLRRCWPAPSATGDRGSS